MTDRDLIAEGRAILKTHATSGVLVLGQWVRANLGAVLDDLETLRDIARDRRDEIVCLQAELEAKRAQHAETLGYLEHAYEVIKAAQRPQMSDGARLSDGELERISELFETFEPGPALYWARRTLRELEQTRFALEAKHARIVTAELREVPNA